MSATATSERTYLQAISDDGSDLAPGSSVEITGSDGAILRVKAA